MNDARYLEGGFRYTPRTFTLRHVIHSINEKEIIINPEFKYIRTWTKALKVQLVESVLLGIPVPEIWLEENHYSELTILEGAHLLECLMDFSKDKFPLTGCRIIPDVENRYYSELPFSFASAFLNRTVIEARIISYDTAPLLKYEFFKLLNLEKRNFIAQIARNYAFPRVGKFLRNLTEECRSLVRFQDSDTSYTQISFKRPFEVDRVYLLIVAMVLLKRGHLLPSSRDIESLLDEAMLFVNDNTQLHDPLNMEVKDCLVKITDKTSYPLWVNFGFSKARHKHYEFSDEHIHVDTLLYACVQVLNKQSFSLNLYQGQEKSYLRHPTTRRLFNDLL
ncbi:hypothetical protein ACN1C3_26960 [Pseudomonas sp. H11T01]|uniref:hypothetical protein n=1 Tax=Pseudomonas sp. H11T01 TaxID=3402749 RepID=UPI003AC3CA5A